MKRILSAFLSTALMLTILCSEGGLQVQASAVFENGDGTPENPYCVATAAELQQMNEDLSASYILTADIDLNGIPSFTPIGNENDGAFTGTLDGNGHTVKNLNISGNGKFTGLIGYLEGTIQDLTLSDCTVHGGRYTAALTGYISEGASVTDCIVADGSVTVGKCILENYGGGISAYCAGTITRCTNRAVSVLYTYSLSYGGGITGYLSETGTIVGPVQNSGTINASTVGGIIGKSESTLLLENCTNYGKIEGYHSGGILGYGFCDIADCVNCGTANCNTSNSYSGGIAGVWYGATISRCVNYANIGGEHCGGIVGAISSDPQHGSTSATLENCTNCGAVVGGDRNAYPGEFVSQCNTVTLNGCMNTGYAQYSASNALNGTYYGLVGYGTAVVSNFVEQGCCDTFGVKSANESIAYSLPSVYGTCVELLYPSVLGLDADYKKGTPVAFSDITDIVKTNGWDFEEDWTADSRYNSGLPTPKNNPSQMWFNEGVLILEPGESRQLTAYINSQATGKVTYSSLDSTIATVSQNGILTTVANGRTLISAVTKDGMRANCLVIVQTPTTQLSIVPSDITVGLGKSYEIKSTQDTLANEPILWSSSDPQIVSVHAYSSSSDACVIANNQGEATITAQGAISGISATALVRVNTALTELKFSQTSYTVNIGSSQVITPTASPSGYIDPLTWRVEDETVAQVTQDGTVTGLKPGITRLVVSSESGLEASAILYVKQPAASITIDAVAVTVEVGYTYPLTAELSPEDSTDSVTWRSDNTNIATVNSGVICGVTPGKTIITATTDSGRSVSVAVTVIAALPKSVEDITLSDDALHLQPEETKQLSVSVLPLEAEDKTIVWTSSNESAATVSSDGLITAVAAGKTIVTASSVNGIYRECSVVVGEGTGPMIWVENARGIVGNTVDVPVRISQNSGIAAFSLSLSYDTTVLTPEEILPGGMFESGTMSDNLSDTERSSLHVTWYNTENVTEDGILFTVRFRIAEEAALESQPISVSYTDGELCNAEKQSLTLTCVPGSAKVLSSAAGDLNADGEIGMKDIVLLCRYFNELETLTAAQLDCADILYDEALQANDLVQMAEILMNQEPEEEEEEEEKEHASARNFRTNASLLGGTAEPAEIQVQTTAIAADGTLEIPVSFANCAALSAFRLYFRYPENMEVLQITPSDALTSGTFLYKINTENDLGMVMWYAGSDVAMTDTLFTVKVQVNSGAYGDYPLSFQWNQSDICTASLSEILLKATTSAVHFSASAIVTEANLDEETGCVTIALESNAMTSAEAYALVAFYQDGKYLSTKWMLIDLTSKRITIPVEAPAGYDTYKVLLVQTDFVPVAPAVTGES